MNIPVFELKRQFQQIKGEINKTIKEVLNSGFYILGKNVTGSVRTFPASMVRIFSVALVSLIQKILLA